ncbi:hypothetical protein BT69DRAFT_1392423 [Atractiella rhizophila]|nr:hypothetical protein BT69DRAFT_1392423 [Atractiella rhizophila]
MNNFLGDAQRNLIWETPSIIISYASYGAPLPTAKIVIAFVAGMGGHRFLGSFYHRLASEKDAAMFVFDRIGYGRSAAKLPGGNKVDVFKLSGEELVDSCGCLFAIKLAENLTDELEEEIFFISAWPGREWINSFWLNLAASSLNEFKRPWEENRKYQSLVPSKLSLPFLPILKDPLTSIFGQGTPHVTFTQRQKGYQSTSLLSDRRARLLLKSIFAELSCRKGEERLDGVSLDVRMCLLRSVSPELLSLSEHYLNFARLGKVKLVFFHGEKDELVPVKRIEEMVAFINGELHLENEEQVTLKKVKQKNHAEAHLDVGIWTEIFEGTTEH